MVRYKGAQPEAASEGQLTRRPQLRIIILLVQQGNRAKHDFKYSDRSTFRHHQCILLLSVRERPSLWISPHQCMMSRPPHPFHQPPPPPHQCSRGYEHDEGDD